MPNQIAALHLDVVLGFIFAVLVENGGALLWAVVFFHFPIDNETDIVKVVLPTILHVKLVSWCALVIKSLKSLE